VEYGFQVHTKRARLWPVRLYGVREQNWIEFQEITQVEDYINEHSHVYFQTIGTLNDKKQIDKSELLSIQGPLPYIPIDRLSVNEIYSLSEAAKLWKLADGSTLRKAIEKGKFNKGEIRKSDKVWFVTLPGMQRVFDAVPTLFENKVSSIEFNQVDHEEIWKLFQKGE